MTKPILYFLLLFITTFSFSQTKRVDFYGYVKDSTKSIKDAHVINLNTKIGTSTNDFGSFKIPVYIGDTLQITSLNYQTVFYKITKNIFQKNLEQFNYSIKLMF